MLPKAFTINQFCQDAGDNSNNAVVNVLSGTHKLNVTCEVRSVINLFLKGQIKYAVEIECSPFKDSGFRFLNVFNLKISGIKFTCCGTTWTSVKPQLKVLIPRILSALLAF